MDPLLQLQALTCCSHLGQEALRACRGGTGVCMSAAGRGHKYLDVETWIPSVCRWRTTKTTTTTRRLRDANMVLLRLLGFGLLAAAWCFTAAEGEVIYACFNETALMSCDVGSKIKLDHILYKVGVGTRCGEGKPFPDDGTYCTFPWAEMVVEDLCAGKRSCEVPVTDWVFGEYPCKEQTRYLEVSYSCAAPPPPPPPPPAPTKPDCKEPADEA